MNEFDQGYACAVSNLVYSNGSCVEAEEMLIANRLTSIKKLRESKIDENDISILRPVIKAIQRAKLRRDER